MKLLKMRLREFFRNLKETDIQGLYFLHPYLIDRKFEKGRIEQFYSLKSGYADLVVFLENLNVVIELKVEPLKKTHVLQLSQYTEEIKELFPNTEIAGILIGRTPKENLEKLIRTFSFPIKIRILIEDIPVRIKICSNCRYANPLSNDLCWKCGKKDWLMLLSNNLRF